MNELRTALDFAADWVQSVPPEQVMISVASSATTVLAWAGVRLSPRLAMAVGSGAYALLHAVGLIAKATEPSPACRAAHAALSDRDAVYEDAGTFARLVCTGLTVTFVRPLADPSGKRGEWQVAEVRAGREDLSETLKGGRKGAEWKSVAREALARREAVIERDRAQANEEAAVAIRRAIELASLPAEDARCRGR